MFRVFKLKFLEEVYDESGNYCDTDDTMAPITVTTKFIDNLNGTKEQKEIAKELFNKMINTLDAKFIEEYKKHLK